MSDEELLQNNIEEFSRLQNYMALTDKTSEVYTSMKVRYIELKIILMTFDIDITQLDRIKENVA